ncbi:MAG: ABC transporter permease [Gemmatimonadetes bacterium]|nr:ABC transporter permease [Gemmatimonadota bacterium]
MARWPFLRSFSPGQVRSDVDAEIREEIELYLELRANELEDEGLSPEDARRVAQERFGDAEEIKRSLRKQAKRTRARRETTMTMSGLKQDLAYAIRSFRRSPGFTAVAVATLALALGGNTAIFSVVDAALLQALPFEDHEELVFVNGYHLTNGEVAIRGASFPEFRDWNERSRWVSPMAAVGGVSLSATGGDGAAEQLSTEIVSLDYFDVLLTRPALGRAFFPEEHAEVDAHPVAIISHRLWERRYALDPAALTSEIIINDRPLTIVGIMPEAFQGTDLANGTDLWVPDGLVSLIASPDLLESRGSRFLSVVGRLAPGGTVEEAQAELDVVARDLQATFPQAHEDRFAQVQEFRDGYLGDTGGLLWILMGAGIVLLLIAAANVANLLLVRSHSRTREFVLRRALGAEGSRVAGQLLTESFVLAALGGAAGIGVAVAALRILGPMIPNGALPGYVEAELSSTAFLTSLVVLVLVGLATGLLPAASSARIDIATRLREGSKGSAAVSLRRIRPQHVFVVAQVALALILLVGAGLLTRSFRAQLAVDTGVELEGIIAMRISPPNSRYDTNETLWNFSAELERRLGELPGVEGVSLSSRLPFRGGSSGAYIFREGDSAEERIRFHRHHVTPSYFETLGIELREGRLLNDDDRGDSSGVIVITDAMARRVYPGESAVGKMMSLRPDDGMPVEVVGVIEDVRYRDITTSLMEEANSPDVFFSYWQMPSRTLEVAVRTNSAATVVPAMRTVVSELDPELPIFQLEPLEEGRRTQTATPRFAAFLMSLFSGLAVLLACVGIYGVLAFTVGQRSQEIAIRRAIGASGVRVARAVVGDGLRLTLVGLLLGGAGAVAGSRVLETFLFGVEATDPATFVSVAGGMIAVAVVAAVLPALRAMRRDPAEALNSD